MHLLCHCYFEVIFFLHTDFQLRQCRIDKGPHTQRQLQMYCPMLAKKQKKEHRKEY
jgi:hypothetical protein